MQVDMFIRQLQDGTPVTWTDIVTLDLACEDVTPMMMLDMFDTMAKYIDSEEHLGSYLITVLNNAYHEVLMSQCLDIYFPALLKGYCYYCLHSPLMQDVTVADNRVLINIPLNITKTTSLMVLDNFEVDEVAEIYGRTIRILSNPEVVSTKSCSNTIFITGCSTLKTISDYTQMFRRLVGYYNFRMLRGW